MSKKQTYQEKWVESRSVKIQDYFKGIFTPAEIRLFAEIMYSEETYPSDKEEKGFDDTYMKKNSMLVFDIIKKLRNMDINSYINKRFGDYIGGIVEFTTIAFLDDNPKLINEIFDFYIYLIENGASNWAIIKFIYEKLLAEGEKTKQTLDKNMINKIYKVFCSDTTFTREYFSISKIGGRDTRNNIMAIISAVITDDRLEISDVERKNILKSFILVNNASVQKLVLSNPIFTDSDISTLLDKFPAMKKIVSSSRKNRSEAIQNKLFDMCFCNNTDHEVDDDSIDTLDNMVGWSNLQSRLLSKMYDNVLKYKIRDCRQISLLENIIGHPNSSDKILNKALKYNGNQKLSLKMKSAIINSVNVKQCHIDILRKSGDKGVYEKLVESASDLVKRGIDIGLTEILGF